MLWSTGTWAQAFTIPIETAHNALVLQVDQNRDVKNIYLGKKLDNAAEYSQLPGIYNQSGDYTGLLNSAYTPSGSRNLVEPAITVTHADGNQSLDLRYKAYKQTKINDDVSLLSVSLKDPVYDFEVELFYKSYYITFILYIDI